MCIVPRIFVGNFQFRLDVRNYYIQLHRLIGGNNSGQCVLSIRQEKLTFSPFYSTKGNLRFFSEAPPKNLVLQ